MCIRDSSVTTGYELTLGSVYTPQYKLSFKVNDKDVNDLRNSFQYAEDGTLTADASKKLFYDYAWTVSYTHLKP